jgi:3'(2'), 5'-bisphosphate nucleotidase
MKFDAELLHEVGAIASEAAKIILGYYGADYAVRHKTDGSPVTEADLAAHSLIRDRLRTLTPSIPVVSEEDEPGQHTSYDDYTQFWLVDPLDGTRGFTDQTGDFAVNIALVNGTEAVLGVVHWPLRAASYRGAQGMPATRHDADGLIQEISVSGKSERPLTLVTSRSRNNPLTRRFVEALEPCEQFQRGSAIKTCLVAEGSADLYPAFGETSYWDTAAPQALLEAAGGQLTDLDLNPLRYDLSKGMLNPSFIAFGAARELWRHALPAPGDRYW